MLALVFYILGAAVFFFAYFLMRSNNSHDVIVDELKVHFPLHTAAVDSGCRLPRCDSKQGGAWVYERTRVGRCDALQRQAVHELGQIQLGRAFERHEFKQRETQIFAAPVTFMTYDQNKQKWMHCVAMVPYFEQRCLATTWCEAMPLPNICPAHECECDPGSG